ncbi:Membrane protein tms1 [Kappamyces sp. JEL0680]|nr:Membrane protein tms1 [Kappamyces sp. JEL0680]
MTISTAVVVKLTYSCGYVLAVVFAYVLSMYGAAITSGIPNLFTAVCSESCFQTMAVYKISFGQVCYHLVLCVLVLGVCDSEHPRSVIHTDYWLYKTLGWLVLFFGSFFIPHSFFLNYSYAAISFSALFIVIQTLQLVDFACTMAEYLIQKYDDTGGRLYRLTLIASAALCFTAVLVITVVLCLYYAQCPLNQFLIAFNLLLVILVNGCSVVRKFQKHNPKFGLLQSAFVSLYTTYLVASALALNSSSECTQWGVGSDSSDSLALAVKYLGLVFAFLSLGYTALSTGTTSISGTDKDSVSPSFFHFIFCLASFYMACVLTEWSEVSVSSPSGVYSIVKGLSANYWLKISTSWFCVVLYLWVLMAPTLLVHREFAQ